MIEHFKNIGRLILDEDGYYTNDNPQEKRRIFLKHQTLVPRRPTKDTVDRTIELHFETSKRQCYFQLGSELESSSRESLFALKSASNDKKKFLSTNNIKILTGNLFGDLLDWLRKKRTDKITASWFSENVSTNYTTLIESLHGTFYQKLEDKEKKKSQYILNNSCLSDSQREKFSETMLVKKKKNPGKQISLMEIYLEFLIGLFGGGDIKNLSRIVLAKIDGKHIMEIEHLRDDYVNIAYYDLLERFFTEESKTGNYCHACRTAKESTGKVSLIMKFYGTTNKLYFENASDKNTYKSFALCRQCLTEVLTGMRYTENFHGDYLFDINCYLIPSIDGGDQGFDKKIKAAGDLLKNKKGRYHNSIEKIKELLRKSSRSRTPFTFDMMFYFKDKNQFDILKYIRDIQLHLLAGKLERFDHYTDTYELDLLARDDLSLRLNDFRFYLFPSKYSHVKADFNVYGKALLAFLENFLNERPFNYMELVSRFTGIYKGRMHRGNIRDYNLSPFKMVLFLSILHQIGILKEATYMNKGESISTVACPDYREFFEAHPGVYGDHAFRQGLFLLGTVISRVIWKQKDKRRQSNPDGKVKASSTFMGKLNLDGVPPRRVPELAARVREFAGIYNVYDTPGTWGNIMDRLQGVENSGMKREDVIFYILTGISYEDYLGMKVAHEKKTNGQ